MNPRRPSGSRIIALLILLGAAGASHSAVASCEDGSIPAYFNLRVGGFEQCPLFLGGPSPIVYVYVDVYAVPFRKARLSLPDPPFGIVLGESWNLLFTGNRTTGIEFDLGDCSPAGFVTLGYLLLFVAPGTLADCESWKVDDACEIDDCEGVTRAGYAQPYRATTATNFCWDCCWQCCQSLPQYDLFPPNGTADVPLDVALSWDGTPDYLDPQFGYFCYVRIGTDPGCGTGQTIRLVDCNEQTFAPDFLERGTTYYWQVGWNAATGSGCSSGAYGESPTFSFTTEGPLAVTPTTWGRVKAMYRE